MACGVANDGLQYEPSVRLHAPDQWARFYNIKRLIVVADRGLLSQYNVNDE
jgi:hypothetical protein